MINLFISKPNQSDDAEDESTKLRIQLLKELETVIWSAIISAGRVEARVWLCKTLAGFNHITPREQRAIFINFLKVAKKKRDLASQLLNLMIDLSPQKLGSVLARNSRFLESFFIGNTKCVLHWFSFIGLEQGKGLSDIKQYFEIYFGHYYTVSKFRIPRSQIPNAQSAKEEIWTAENRIFIL